MKILEVKEDKIIFNNGKELTYDHEQDCCEYNYADFSQLEEEVMKHNFYEPLDFEAVEGSGFRFGNKKQKNVFCALLFRAKWILHKGFRHLL